jgi:hypothetical protein
MEKRAHRPWLVTIVALGVFCLSVGSFIQAAQTIAQSNNLSSLPLSAPAWYFLAGGIFWGLAWLASGIGLWRMTRWGIPLSLCLLPIHLAVWLFDRLLLDRAPVFRNAIGFDLVIRIILASLAAGALLLARRMAKRPVPPQPDHEG